MTETERRLLLTLSVVIEADMLAKGTDMTLVWADGIKTLANMITKEQDDSKQ